MDFDFSDDQEQLRDAVRKWVDKGYDFERRRAIADAGGFDRAAYGDLVDLGLAGLYIPEEHGGMGMGPVEGMVVMEELGRGIVLEPLAQTLVAWTLIEGHPTVGKRSSFGYASNPEGTVDLLAHARRQTSHDRAPLRPRRQTFEHI